jgi:hypothetical protein
MAERMKLKPSDLAHRLAASLYRHVGLLVEGSGRPKLRVSRDACFEVARRQAEEFERQDAEIFVRVAPSHSWPPRDPPADDKT